MLTTTASPLSWMPLDFRSERWSLHIIPRFGLFSGCGAPKLQSARGSCGDGSGLIQTDNLVVEKFAVDMPGALLVLV